MKPETAQDDPVLEALEEGEVLFALQMSTEHDDRHQALALRTWIKHIEKWYAAWEACLQSKASEGADKDEALNMAIRALNDLSHPDAYSGERTSGILDGCRRGPDPAPEELATRVRIVCDEVKRLAGWKGMLAASPKPLEPKP